MLRNHEPGSASKGAFRPPCSCLRHHLRLTRPHYSRVEDEGRTFIQMALQDTADIEPTDDQLQIRLAPLSSPHRSRALESLCDALNKTNTLFPGTRLQIHYVVAPACLEAKNGQVPQ